MNAQNFSYLFPLYLKIQLFLNKKFIQLNETANEVIIKRTLHSAHHVFVSQNI